MNPNDSNFEVGRKNPASGVHLQFGESNIVLLTVTTEKRIPWLATAESQRFLQETWKEAQAWLVGDYLLMPDHLHAFCAPRDFSFSIEEWITFWKRDFRRRHGRKEWCFQARGWHHRLRNGEEHSTKWLYVQENPIRKGLVKRIEDWPYKGTVHYLRW
jgi:putative transposase